MALPELPRRARGQLVDDLDADGVESMSITISRLLRRSRVSRCARVEGAFPAAASRARLSGRTSPAATANSPTPARLGKPVIRSMFAAVRRQDLRYGLQLRRPDRARDQRERVSLRRLGLRRVGLR